MKEQEGKYHFSIKEAFVNWIGLFLVIMAALAICFVVINFKGIMHIATGFLKVVKPVLYGCVIAYLVNPLVKVFQGALLAPWEKKEKRLSDKCKKAIENISIVLGLISAIFLIVILLWMVLPQVFESITTLVENLPEQANYYYQRLTKWVQGNPLLAEQLQKVLLQLTDFFDSKMNTELFPWLQKELLPNVNTYAMQLASGLMGFFNVVYNLLIGLIVAVYLLNGKRQFLAQAKKMTYGLFRKDHADVLIHYVRLTNDMFSGFIAGKIVDSTIIGIICFVFMWLFDLPYAVLVSIIVGVTNVIPVFGPYIGAIPCILLILLVNPVQALYFLIFIVILQQMDGNVIGPAILGESTGLSAFWVLFAILLFGGLWGLVGMLVGVPLFAVIYQLLSDVVNAGLRKKSLSTDTSHYLDLREILPREDGMVFVKYSEKELLQGAKKEKQESGFATGLREVWSERKKQSSSRKEKKTQK